MNVLNNFVQKMCKRKELLGYGILFLVVSVFYGDLFLYVSAFLRLLGMSLQNAYKAYVLLCNLATVAIAGYSFYKIFGNRWVGLFGSTLYSLAVYRLINVYVRSSLGEYTGMMILPLIAYACVLLLNEERDKGQIRKGAYLLGISMAALIQSHILTCEIVGVMLALVFLWKIRRVCCREVMGGIAAPAFGSI